MCPGELLQMVISDSAGNDPEKMLVACGANNLDDSISLGASRCNNECVLTSLSERLKIILWRVSLRASVRLWSDAVVIKMFERSL